MNKKLFLLLLILLMGSYASTHDLSKCIQFTDAGFLHGFWQGIISPLSFVLSLFEKDITVYEVANNEIGII